MKKEHLTHSKSAAFYDVFTRKGEGEKITHYCPGCGHGVAHKLIAEATTDLGLNDRVIFCSPVGCSVFAYHYFDYGNIECAHGRAPAVATGLKRTREDAIVISYQGDGDLAGIGMGAIMHAANRGELVSVFFINNAVYGMTGGQMAPTTLLGQKTMTTPSGRSLEREGRPIGMAEVMDSLKTPVYVERVSLSGPAGVMKARSAIRKSLKYQNERKGFSFVEILSPCPVNWKMTPIEASKWMKEEMEKVFPVKLFRDMASEIAPYPYSLNLGKSDEELFKIVSPPEIAPMTPAPVSKLENDLLIKIAGFGGQGIMSAGILSANCAVFEGLNATWIPSYGAEMRGGTANASVIMSKKKIGNPVVSEPAVLIAMNQPSLMSFQDSVIPGGTIFVNSSLVHVKPGRSDVKAVFFPATQLANELGSTATASVMMLAVFALVTGAFSIETLKHLIPFSIHKKNLIDVNIKAIDLAITSFEKNRIG